MNTNNIKRYAPKARTDFIAAMTKQAAKYGITSKGIEPLEQKGDLALIGDRPFPAGIIRPRAALVKKVEQMGFTQAMEQAAYSWFNRLCAIRFMEIKGYLDHGRRVLSHPEQEGSFQILDDCLDIALEGLDGQRIKELKLDGTKDEELYRELLLTQCHALHQAMPFLFEAIDDATELLLPDNLTKTDSLIRELVSAIPEEDWQNVEIIGWLYQFYISEKKEEVIGKVVKSEDIPAATQLFTPNWIVQYLVQNSVGRQWLQTYPDSPLKAKMEYYIEPAEQTPEVQAQLAAITPDSIDPLSIKVLDPACGSGHILVEAYKVLKEIYSERGFRSRDIPQLILENNLFGLDIDDRAGQLAGFALMMLAREDDRRIFSRLTENNFKLNVLSLQESSHLNFASLWQALNLTSDWQRGQSQGLFDNDQKDPIAPQTDNRYQLLKATLARFTQAKTFGSLIEVPSEDAEPLNELLEQLRQLAREGDSIQKSAAEKLIPYVQQAKLIAQRYSVIVANPPYMGSKYYNAVLKQFVNNSYPDAKGDLYSAFIDQNLKLAAKDGYVGMITIPNWMFLTSFETIRNKILRSFYFDTFVHNGRGVWGSDFGSCSFVIRKSPINSATGRYKRLFDKQGSVATNEELSARFFTYPEYQATPKDFETIPGTPIAYWLSKNFLDVFMRKDSLGKIAKPVVGLQTGDNDRFIRFWHELAISSIGFSFGDSEAAKKSKLRWFPYTKGGDFRKWYGNNFWVINWENDGETICSLPGAFPRNRKKYFQEGLAYTNISASSFASRYTPKGFIFDQKGSMFFDEIEGGTKIAACLLHSSVGAALLSAMCPTLDFNPGTLSCLPLVNLDTDKISEIFDKCTAISKSDWDSSEISWDFLKSKLLRNLLKTPSRIRENYDIYKKECITRTNQLKNLEELNNKYLIDTYKLNDELTAEVNPANISLMANPIFRFGPTEDSSTVQSRFKAETIAEEISYAVGCMMGRFSLDREGLIYAHAGNQGFAQLVSEGAYKTFSADSDGILPLTDREWFADDATNRFREFVRTVWGEEHLQENLDFVAESLCLSAIKPKRGESALDCIRRYLSTQFYKDHLKTYKKRPIYWLFSSGKHKAFECLVYLHRYHEGTLARMRTEYVIPLTSKLNTYANKLEQDIDASTSTAEKKRLEKELDTLHKQQAELATFDEKLRHFADQRISLDLDDGVKVNYGKFGDLLAEVKAITG